MASPATAPTERDAASVQEARTLVQRAKQAAPILAEFSQEQIDRIVDAVAAATAKPFPCSPALAASTAALSAKRLV